MRRLRIGFPEFGQYSIGAERGTYLIGGRDATLIGSGITGVPFSDGFEDGTLNAWDVAFGSMPVTTTQAYEGSRSSMITAPGGGTPNDNYLEYNFADHPTVGGTPVGTHDLWIRVAHKWGSNWNDNGYASVQKIFLLNTMNPTSGARRFQMTFNIWTPDLGYFCEFLRWNEGGGSGGNTTSNIGLGVTRVLNQWIEFVFHVRMNNPLANDGVLQIWSRTELESSYTQRVNRSDINYNDATGFSPNRLIQSNYQPDGIPSGNRYWDSWQLQATPIDVSSTSEEAFGSWNALDISNQQIYRINANAGDTPTTNHEGSTVTLFNSGNVDGGPFQRVTPLIVGVAPNTGQGSAGVGAFSFRNVGFNIRKLNMRWEQRMGSAWINEIVQMDKWIIVQSGATQNAGSNNGERPMFYLSDMDTQAGDAPSALQRSDLMAVGVASGTVKNFEPLQSGFAGYNWPRGNEQFYFGASNTTIAGKRVVDATQWYTFEIEIISDVMSNWPSSPVAPVTNGSTRGLIRLVIWNRANEILTDLYIPYNWDGGWSVGNDFIIEMEVIGGYMNSVSNPSANNYIDVANVTFAANRDGLIMPRAGFLT